MTGRLARVAKATAVRAEPPLPPAEHEARCGPQTPRGGASPASASWVPGRAWQGSDPFAPWWTLGCHRCCRGAVPCGRVCVDSCPGSGPGTETGSDRRGGGVPFRGRKASRDRMQADAARRGESFPVPRRMFILPRVTFTCREAAAAGPRDAAWCVSDPGHDGDEASWAGRGRGRVAVRASPRAGDRAEVSGTARGAWGRGRMSTSSFKAP